MSPGLTLRVGVSPYKEMNLSCFAMYIQGNQDCEPGMELEILSTIASTMNVTMEMVVSNGTGCGSQLPDGTWTGLMGMLERDEIDVTGNLCSIKEDRTAGPYFEPSWPVLTHRQGFLIKKPSVEYKFDIFAPFQLPVWLTLLSMAIFITVLTAAFTYCFTRERQKGSVVTSKSFFATFQSFDPSLVPRHDYPRPKLLWAVWIICFGITSGIYAAYITVVLLSPVAKYRPFSNQAELAEALLKGEYKLLDYHRDHVSLPQCYSNATCEKFRLAIKLHQYVQAKGDTDEGGSLLAKLLAPGSDNLVMVNSYYWLQMYADTFGGRRSDLWLIDDEMSGEKWSSFFLRRNASFNQPFNYALIQMDAFKYYLPELYVPLARHVFRGKSFRGSLPETYTLNINLMGGPGRIYAVGMIAAVIVFCLELCYSWCHRERVSRKVTIVTIL